MEHDGPGVRSLFAGYGREQTAAQTGAVRPQYPLSRQWIDTTRWPPCRHRLVQPLVVVSAPPLDHAGIRSSRASCSSNTRGRGNADTAPAIHRQDERRPTATRAHWLDQLARSFANSRQDALRARAYL